MACHMHELFSAGHNLALDLTHLISELNMPFGGSHCSLESAGSYSGSYLSLEMPCRLPFPGGEQDTDDAHLSG
jgi:hypothetical protein